MCRAPIGSAPKIVDYAGEHAQPNEVNDPHQLLSSVMKVAALVQDRLEAALAPSGLSLAKLGALRQLAEAGEPLPLGQLAERIACVKSNVTQLVDRLEAEGLVRRLPDPGDRRSVRASITEKGQARYLAGVQLMVAAENALVNELLPGDQQMLEQLLERLALIPAS